MKRVLTVILAFIMLILPLYGSVSFAAAPAETTQNGASAEAQLAGRAFVGSTLPFVDVPYDRWDYSAIAFGYKNGFINGMSETYFAPKSNITRGQFVTLLGVMDNINKDSFSAQVFTDVTPDRYYFHYVNWAAYKTIVAGMTKTTFCPDINITREQLARIIWKYAEYRGAYTYVSSTKNLSAFPDNGKVSSYAREALSWCVSKGIVNGSNGKLLPQNTATRAEAAQMIYKFVDNVLHPGADMSKVSVSGAISSDMVVQRCEPVNIWGTAKPSENGKYVHASLYGAAGSAEIKNGEWKITLDKNLNTSAKPGNSLLIWGNNKDKAVEFKDILVGDVYLIAGQSNVHFNIHGYEIDNSGNVGNAIAFRKVTYSNDTPIRLFRNSMMDSVYATDNNKVGTFGVHDPEPIGDVFHNRGWQKPLDIFGTDTLFESGVNAGVIAGKVFSAVGYVYALRLYERTNVPVGMLEIDASGLDIAAFMPNELASKFDRNGEYQMLPGIFFQTTVDPITTMPTRFVYNQQIYAVKNFALAGLIWYQGESDWMNNHFRLGFGENAQYLFIERFKDLMTYLRNDFANGDWPVYIVELPSCYSTYSDGTTSKVLNGIQRDIQFIDFSKVRTELGIIPNILENSYVVSSSDLWKDRDFWNNIHPYCKYDQGVRIANQAFATNYVGGDPESEACPQVDSVEYKGNSVVITYRNVGPDGLALAKGKTKLLGYEVCVDPDPANWDCDRIGFSVTNPDAWVDVDRDSGMNAEITAPNQVTITARETIYGVRYNAVIDYQYPADLTLCSSTGLPAAAFADYSEECVNYGK